MAATLCRSDDTTVNDPLFTISFTAENATAKAGQLVSPFKIGCWYYEYIGSLPAGKTAPIVDGTFTVEYSAPNDAYRFVIDALDDLGNSFKAEFNGILPEFTDESGELHM